MKCFILVTAVLFSIGSANAQLQNPGDTLTAGIKKNATVSGDTVFFKHQDNLIRFFNRYIRMPYDGGLQYGYCTLYFIIDTSGKVSGTRCEQVTNEKVAKEMLRVTNKLTGLSPTYIKNKPVITKVRATIAFFNSEKATDDDKNAVDIWVIGYEPVH